MEKGKLLLPNFDARIPKITIKPKNTHTTVKLLSKVYDESLQKKVNVKVLFDHVAAIDFQINYFNNVIGAEAWGLYEIEDRSFIETVLKENFEKRKSIFLLEGHYDYHEDDPNDMLNDFDFSGCFANKINNYHAYIQNVDAGVYIIIAKQISIIKE